MRKLLALFMLAGLLILTSCELKVPTQPELNVAPNQLVLNKVVAVGASFTAGFQSGGLLNDFQQHSFPYLIAKSMGEADEYQMPLIGAPGVGSTPGFGPLQFVNGSIAPGEPIPGGIDGVPALLQNALLPRPYDNLGVPGADLNDILTTVDGSGGNPFFDIILRNPNFGNATQLKQAIALQPSLILLPLPGGNDALGAALSGTAIVEPAPGFTITSQDNYLNRLTQIVDAIQAQTRAKIVTTNLPNMNALPYVSILDPFIYRTLPGFGTLPMVFGPDFQPVDFDPGPGVLYIPLLTEESVLTVGSPVKHVLLPFLSQYQATGLGVPDSAALVPLLIASGVPPSIAPAQAQALVQGMIASGLTPSGVPIPGNLTLTEAEEATISGALDGYNATIASLAQSKGMVMIDLVTPFNNLVAAGPAGVDGVSALFVFLDPVRTIFSLDGFHPSNAGQAFLAKEIIKGMNAAFGLSLTPPTPADFVGQYAGVNAAQIVPGAIEQAMKIYFPEQRSE